ncbi:MAG: phosphomethylpyrimidine synthase ThiC, partial [Elusimicrobiota bacterium]
MDQLTLIDFARAKKIIPEIRSVAGRENISPEFIVRGLASGRLVVPYNLLRRNKTPAKNFKICAIGSGTRTKVNANIGTSPECLSVQKEMEKLNAAIDAGTDTVMDLSTGGNLRNILEKILKHSNVPVGTVPIYQAVCEVTKKGKEIFNLEPERLFSVIEEHASLGVDFITVHCGVTRKSVNSLLKKKRICGVVSRGGAFLTEWIIKNEKENPLYSDYERLLDIAHRYDVTLSLGDGMRPGSIADANDEAQISELKALSELVKLARKRNVGVMVEGPGHMPLDKIKEHINLEKHLTDGAPFYVLGPVTCDVAVGYDHITSAIGGAVAAASGADFLCYVTPSEHIHLPDVSDVKEGVIAARIAAHSGDIAKGIPGAFEWDRKFSKYRFNLDWFHQERTSIDPEKFKQQRRKFSPVQKDVCTMCGHFCSMKKISGVL